MRLENCGSCQHGEPVLSNKRIWCKHSRSNLGQTPLLKTFHCDKYQKREKNEPRHS